jgi:hypothetical protein
VNNLSKTFIPLFLAVGMLVSCNSFISTPTTSAADTMETAISTVRTAFAETQRAIPTATPGLLPLPTVSFLTTTPVSLPPTSLPTTPPSSTPLVFTDPSVPLSGRIVYYYFVKPAENPIPLGTVLAVHPFAPTYSDETYTSDTAADLRTALDIILHVDSRRIWDSSDLEIVDVTFRNGHADVLLQGQYLAAGDAQPCAGSLQILLTVFANPSVQTAAVTLNEGQIGTLCIFREESAPYYLRPENGVYTRTEIETYMKENAYVSP